MLALAGLRSAGDPRESLAMDDPPSLTYRITAGKIGLAEIPTHVRSEPPVTHRRARAEATPKIDWHHATSVGLPYGGSLVDGTQLPVEGPNWVTWDPVTDSVPNAPHRLYGNERTIRTILRVTDAYRAAHPEAPRVVIGDISREGGGPMTDEHVSHQNGLDVDVYFPRRDATLRAPTATDQIDRRLAQDLARPLRRRRRADGLRRLLDRAPRARRASSSRTRATRTTCTSASRRPAASPRTGRRRRHVFLRGVELFCEKVLALRAMTPGSATDIGEAGERESGLTSRVRGSSKP